MVVFKGVQEIAMIFQVVLIDLRQFVAERQKKIKFDSPPILRSVKIIPLKIAGYEAGK